ncbi:class A beta-lactamase-related serine hydrolase [Alteromonadaceae bacterium M269]|nr:class A beta-lactamase-related serine hydrolase [Alteromonadaceae bacterium M269]
MFFCSTLLLTCISHADIVQGMDTERLARIEQMVGKHVDNKTLVGASALVARNGEIVYVKTMGMRDRENNLPMEKDTIMRFYSMTKPMTTVAALILWEQGKFHMSDPIAKYIPQLTDLQVYVSGEGENMVTEPAKGPIRIIDLFLHTSGFSYGFTQSPVDKLYQQFNVRGEGRNGEQAMAELAKLPLVHQPGTAWNYSVSTDVIGYLVEVLSGQSLGDFLEQNVFKPLKMKDTGFFVPQEKWDRLAKLYTANPANGETVHMTQEPLGDFKSNPVFQSGGGGITSTILDYYRFAQMLLNKGELEGVRILAPKTVEYMTSDHLPESVPYVPGEGYGLAISVTTEPRLLPVMASKGNYGWAGLASTYFRIDPVENLIMIGATQYIPPNGNPYRDDLRTAVYQALVE